MKSNKFEVIQNSPLLYDGSSDALQLLYVNVFMSYLREWNNSNNDFICLAKNGVPINDCIYRVPNPPPYKKQQYFILSKYVESIYSYEFLKEIYPKESRSQLDLRKKHLESRYCIIDINGIEKKEFKQFETPYLIEDSCIYKLNDRYYNIETGELYCYSSHSMNSREFLFIENRFDNEWSKNGVLKINKKDGSFELFS